MNKQLLCDKVADLFDKNNQNFATFVECRHDEDFSEDDEEIQYSCGVTKTCLTNVDDDYVIKVPICDYDDYCNLESDIYTGAVAAGVNKILAETAEIGEVDGVTVYAQERVASIGTKSYDSNKLNNREIALKVMTNYRCFDRMNLCFISDMLNQYGYELVCNLAKFLDDNDVNDLHNGNYGYRANGEPVIFDFSGFHDNDDDSDSSVYSNYTYSESYADDRSPSFTTSC